MMAILGVLFAVVYMAVFYGGTAISVALTPLGLSAFGFELIYGVWFMAATIAAYIIRKPGAALITEVLASAIELLMGNSGVIAKLACDGLARTGVLRSYAVGARLAPVSIDDEEE